MPQGVFNTDGAYFLLEIFLAGGCAVCYRMALAIQIDAPETLERQQLFALFVLAISLLIAVAAIPLAGRFSLGRIFSIVLVLAAGRLGGMGLGCAAGLCAGLSMDAVSGTLYFSMAYALSAMTAGLRRCGRARYTLLFLFGTVLSLFWCSAETAVYTLLETAIAGVLFLLLPEKLFQKGRRHRAAALGAPNALEKQLRGAASVFRDLYDSLSRAGTAPVNDENVATVFDRRRPDLPGLPPVRYLLGRDYVTTYNALNDVTEPLNSRGHVLPSDFPPTSPPAACAFPILPPQ